VPTLEQGRIVWAEVVDSSSRNRKARPLIILTPSEEVPPGEPLVAVAVTTQLPKPLPADYVPLPWHAQKRVGTRLSAPCAAVCTWLVEIQDEDILERAGVVPRRQLAEIVRLVSELN
jgi:mRNA-degrading endonuclease toxin of MazEF toxin-antitoxin module